MYHSSQSKWKSLAKMSRRLSWTAFSLSLLPYVATGCASNTSKDRWVQRLSQPQSAATRLSDNQAPQALPVSRSGAAHVQAASYSAPQTGNSGAAVQTAYAMNTAPGQNVAPVGFGHRALYDPQCPPVHNCNPAAIGYVGALGQCGCSPDGSCNEHAGCGPAWPAMPQPWDQQEYIFDGGDHDPKVVVVSDGSVAGLQVEDTVMHYETEDGRLLVDPSCRTKIYSPRFAAVRKVTNVAANGMAIAAIPAAQPAGPSSINDKTPSQTVMLGQHIKREDGVKLMEEVRDRNRGVPAEGIIPFVAINDAQRAMEDVDFIQSGIIREDQWWKIAKGTEAALQWDGIDGVHIFIGADEAMQIRDTLKPAELHLYELREARVRICKVASDTLANPGDEITFTIRFDNSGEQPIKNIVILDNLSPRLEYVEGSQTSSIVNVIDATNFTSTPNEVGSSVLRWEVKSEMKPGEGGWIRFRCKVR
jgi:uncharacterized repeat protein (TIGR01451 family)